MARPRKSTKQEFYDVFADFPVDEQAIVLTFLEEIHRQAVRQAVKRANDPHLRAVAMTREMDGAFIDGLDGAPK